jgi:RimJ/RimL family protein N-acetyltransferase
LNQIIETDRLTLREFVVSDYKKLYELNSDSDVLKYTGDFPFNSVLDAKRFIENYSDYKRNGFGRWVVIHKGSNKFLGWCGLKLNEENIVDIGFRFFKKEWNKGYATESAKAVLNFGFNSLGIDKIIGRTASNNVASIKVLEKLNMNFWKVADCQGIENSLYYTLSKTQHTEAQVQ